MTFYEGVLLRSDSHVITEHIVLIGYNQTSLSRNSIIRAGTSLSHMKCREFKKVSQQNLTCCPGSLVVLDRFGLVIRDSEVQLYFPAPHLGHIMAYQLRVVN